MAAFSYEFNSGFVSKVNANTAGEEIKRISDRDGCVTPETLLEASREPEAPLHNYFEWDEAKAAEKYRISQARLLIANIKIVTTNDKNEREQDRAFVSAPQQNRFVTLQAALSNDDLKEHLLKSARSDAKIFLAKYRRLQELADVNNALEMFLEHTV